MTISNANPTFVPDPRPAATPRRLADATHGPTASRAQLLDDVALIPALWARSRGAETRAVALVRAPVGDVIVTRDGFGLAGPRDMRRARLAVPRRAGLGVDLWRAITLHAFACALSLASLDLGDARLVDVPVEVVDATSRADPARTHGAGPWQQVFAALHRGDVDAVHVRGARAVNDALDEAAVVLIDLDRIRRGARGATAASRVLTAPHRTLQDDPHAVTRELAARGACDVDPEGIAEVAGISRFLWERGFIDRPVDVDAWVDAGPAHATRTLVPATRPLGSTRTAPR